MPLSSIAIPIILAVLKVGAVGTFGYLLARRSILHDSATADISELVIKVAVPCLVFSNAAGGFAGMSQGTAVMLVLAGPLVIGVGYVCSVVLSKLFRVSPSYRTAVVACSAFPNSGYLPLAVGVTVAGVVSAALHAGLTQPAAGNATVIYISLYGFLFSPIFWGVGYPWVADAKRPAPSPWGWARLTELARMIPKPIIGLVAGYVVGFTPLHLILTPRHAPLHFLFEAIYDVGGLTIPLSNLVLGAMLARAGSGTGEPLRNYVIVIATRFLATPAFFMGLFWLTRGLWRDGAGIAAFVVFLESVSPPATNLAVITRASARASAPTLPGSDSTDESKTSRTNEAVPRILLVAYLLAMVAMPIWLMAFLSVMGR